MEDNEHGADMIRLAEEQAQCLFDGRGVAASVKRKTGSGASKQVPVRPDFIDSKHRQ
jgi:hypothetical protein